MKRILITGANSYIGVSFERYMAQWSEQYQVDTVDMIDGTWREKSFAGYDAVYHVAGIAHQKETAENAHMYYQINRDMAMETAEKAKCEGVKHFVFLSTMAVYGIEEGCITRDTIPAPKSNYGKAKYEAEQMIAQIQSEDFIVTIMRPPMVYGEGCKGNYQSLVKFAKVMPFFPDYQNQRSMIHIDRLSWYVKTVLDCKWQGIILPQDKEFVCTCRMVQQIAGDNGKKLRLLKILNPFVSVAKAFTGIGRKAFGDLYYEMTDAEWE